LTIYAPRRITDIAQTPFADVKVSLPILIAVGMVGGLACMVLGHFIRMDGSSRRLLKGTGLELVGKHGPLSVYVDLKATNEIPDYAVFEGNRCVVLMQNTESNNVEIQHFENGFIVLDTKYDSSSHMMERMLYCNDRKGRPKYIYYDVDGDGLWDYFLNETEHSKLVRSNLCWVSPYTRTNGD
jgi:hypothetical protein